MVFKGKGNTGNAMKIVCSCCMLRQPVESPVEANLIRTRSYGCEQEQTAELEVAHPAGGAEILEAERQE